MDKIIKEEKEKEVNLISLFVLFADIFNERMGKGKDGYLLIKFSVPLNLLYTKYEQRVNIDFEPITEISHDLKVKFFSIAKRWYDTTEEMIKASKSAYMLSLITND